MSVTLCRSSSAPATEFDVWTSIQAAKKTQQKDEPYVHPLLSRSSSGLLSQKSLEICTESLGSESGSDDFISSDDDDDSTTQPENQETDEENVEELVQTEKSNVKKELVTVNYHCSISRRSSLPRSFPPPLPSITRRDGPCLQMRPHRRDGRLVVEAVPVPSQNYLHAERHNGRLLLCFINTSSNGVVPKTEQQNEEETMEEIEAEEEQAEAVVEDEEEEEVEVVDRGTVVEVKVSTQPQQTNGSKKVHRSSIVINKFVSCTSAIGNAAAESVADARPTVRRLSTATTTAAAAAVAASSLSALSAADGSHSSTNDNKLLFASKRRNREELMLDMRRCSQLRKPLFIWEPCCIVTST